MLRRAVCALGAVASVAFVACSGDEPATPAATIATADDAGASSTTSTTRRPLTVEEEVEAAYLRSWEVFAEAALELDPSGLEESYAGRALEIVVADIAKWTEDGTPARFDVEHNYEITVDADRAEVADAYVNHSVLLDSETREPIEADPNDVVNQTYVLELMDGTWMVTGIFRD